MCGFASFILTKNNEYYLENSDRYDDIINYYNLKNEEKSLAKVQLIPPENIENIQAGNQWKFVFDENEGPIPDWTYVGDLVLEFRAKAALKRRIAEHKIGYKKCVGDYQNIVLGPYSIASVGCNGLAIAGLYGEATAGNFGQAIAGLYGKATTGAYGQSTTGNYGKAISGDNGISISKIQGFSVSGNYGKAISEDFGQSIAGHKGTAISGYNGTSVVATLGVAKTGINGQASAGFGGVICIEYNVKAVTYWITAKIGENGIKPDTFYKFDSGYLVEVN